MLTWSPRARCPGPSTLDDLGPAARACADALARRYDLGPLLRACGPRERDESLYVLDLLDRFVPAAAGRGLDVGAKNGAYLPGLAAFHAGWDAVELDAHRRYVDLRTRRAVGEAMATALPDCRFFAADVRTLRGPYGLVTWLLPFVFEGPHRAWGLDHASFDPPAVLRHVLSLLAPGAALFVLNQGEDEHAEQGRLFAAAGIDATSLGEVTSVLSPFQKRRLGWLARG